jgi:hypothetical protein
MFPPFRRAILKKWTNIKHCQQIKWCIGLNTIGLFHFSCTTILRNKNYDALIKITPYNLKPVMPICLEELGMIPLRNLACFLGELGPTCPQEPKKHVCQRNLGPFTLGNLSPFASCNHIFPSNLAHLPSTTRFPRELGPICLKQPHIQEELGPFALGKLKVLFSSRKLRKLG